MGSSVQSKASGSDVAMRISSKTMEGRHSNGGTKRTCFKEPRGLDRGLVLMTRDSRGEEPSPEVGGAVTAPPDAPRHGHRTFSHWSSAKRALTGVSDPGRKRPPRDLVVSASPRSSFSVFAALAGTWSPPELQSSSSVVKLANAQKFLQGMDAHTERLSTKL